MVGDTQSNRRNFVEGYTLPIRHCGALTGFKMGTMKKRAMLGGKLRLKIQVWGICVDFVFCLRQGRSM